MTATYRVPVGKTGRLCSCRDESGKTVGASCPRLKNARHGTWSYRIELPVGSDGKRRVGRRRGFADSASAQAELDQVRALLALPDPDDRDAVTRLGDSIDAALHDRRSLPSVEEIRTLLKAGVATLEYPTLGPFLLEWLKGKKGVKKNTYRSYESQVRLYLVPHLETIRLDKLTISHLDDMFEAIVEHNEEIVAARASKDPKRREAVKYQRPVGPSSMQRIRETLRTALNSAIAQQLITYNAAKWVELPPAQRPKPILWTKGRVEHWRLTREVPEPGDGVDARAARCLPGPHRA